MTVECDILFHARLHWVCVCRHYTKAAESRFHIFTLTLSLGEREQSAAGSVVREVRRADTALGCAEKAAEDSYFSPNPSTSLQYLMLRSIWSFWYSCSASLRSLPTGGCQGSRGLPCLARAINLARSLARALGQAFQNSGLKYGNSRLKPEMVSMCTGTPGHNTANLSK